MIRDASRQQEPAAAVRDAKRARSVDAALSTAILQLILEAYALSP